MKKTTNLIVASSIFSITVYCVCVFATICPSVMRTKYPKFIRKKKEFEKHSIKVPFFRRDKNKHAMFRTYPSIQTNNRLYVYYVLYT